MRRRRLALLTLAVAFSAVFGVTGNGTDINMSPAAQNSRADLYCC